MGTKGRLLYCTKCGTGYASIGEIPARCPACDRLTAWSTVSGSSRLPTVPYILSFNDRRFLKAIRIAADEPDSKDATEVAD